MGEGRSDPFEVIRRELERTIPIPSYQMFVAGTQVDVAAGTFLVEETGTYLVTDDGIRLERPPAAEESS